MPFQTDLASARRADDRRRCSLLLADGFDQPRERVLVERRILQPNIAAETATERLRRNERGLWREGFKYRKKVLFQPRTTRSARQNAPDAKDVKRDLLEAVRALKEGRATRPAEEQFCSIGCSIKWKEG